MAPRRRLSGSVVGLTAAGAGRPWMAICGVVLRQRREGEREMKRGWRGSLRAHGEAPLGADLAIGSKKFQKVHLGIKMLIRLLIHSDDFAIICRNTILDFNNGCEIVYAELDAAKSADAMSGGAVPRGLLPIAAARSGCATAISVSSGLTLFSSIMELTGGYV
ncbi:uncharacterized protein LOC119295035 [Triticum dicoccoides]|uniref:uncharacterized protein LOC119295034 n=1 Tax=Triticum dicoccoides TaxID=85692 RepID=UPI00188FA086|nr:uncharacterized protein LOC119295034 [Triticum dicoccoides]XP_037429259.1 uncharacterized protein LOC119295035 [Triticum dicoccoides]